MKEEVYEIKRGATGWWCSEPIVSYCAMTRWGACVAQGKTKAECIKNARSRGYVVPASVVRERVG